MKIQILSDLHLEFEDFEIDYSGTDVLVLAGDTCTGVRGAKWAMESVRDIPVIYVLGNHEYYRQSYPRFVRKMKDLTANTNVTCLENESMTIQDVVFHGCTLWTDFELFGDPRVTGYTCQQRMIDFKTIRKDPEYSKMRSIDIALIHKRSVDWLSRSLAQNKERNNVVVTHHSPTVRSVPESFRQDMLCAAYASDLDALVEALSPQVWIHGHLHYGTEDYHIGRTRVVCNPRGYPKERNQGFEHKFVIDI